MISRLNGRLIEKNPTNLLIECAGVGYEVKISLNTFSALPDAEAIVLHT
jgi:Holliday junction DNA helicase RuvA